MKKTNIGGQALIEGLLMIGPENIAIAVRKPEGEIVLDKKPAPLKTKVTKIPFIRGSVNLFRQMVTGVRALMYSAEFAELEDEGNNEPSKLDAFIERIFKGKGKDAVIYFTVILSLALSIGLFILLPNFLVSLLNIAKEGSGVILKNLLEGLVRIVIFFAYIWLASLMKDIRRVWQYHGAEHKTIHCYEHGDELTVENVRKYSTKHPRCGTSFLFLVMIISILMFSLVGWHSPVVNMLLRILMIPVVAGIAYEVLKFSGKHTEWPVMRIVSAPGMLLQYLTTREPDDDQIEVAITAMKNVIVDDDSDRW
ncbi:MAG TPA: DUF1385 domain-containing protein [Clostridiales bacterium]|nr:DUF1385 domain-containing protein [Clostridiales bacterium]HPP35173.1 DUF1385 domain-containing protein [Clostridiales bacterium]